MADDNIYNTPTTLDSLSQIMNLRSSALQQQSTGLDIQKKQGTLQSDIELARAEANIKTTEAGTKQATQAADIGQAYADWRGKQIKNVTDQNAQNWEKVQRGAQVAGSWVRNNASAESMHSDIENEVKDGILDPDRAQQLHTQIDAVNAKDGQAGLAKLSMQILGKTHDGLDSMKPDYKTIEGVDAGNGFTGTQYTDQNPMSPTFGQSTIIAKASPLVDVKNPETGQPGVKSEAALRRQAAGGGIAPTGVSLGTGDLASASGDHFLGLSKEAAGAQTRIAQLETIMSDADKAAVGPIQSTKQFADSVKEFFGWDEKALADTQSLMKNSKLIAATGGNTDDMRAMIEAATPGVSMSKAAIKKVSSQLIGQYKMPVVAQKHFLQYIQNPAEYMKEKAAFDRVADPRILQFEDGSPAERAQIKADLVRSGQDKAFSEKLKQFEAIRNGK